jgi:Gpi18-like mannosyltransferase
VFVQARKLLTCEVRKVTMKYIHRIRGFTNNISLAVFLVLLFLAVSMSFVAYLSTQNNAFLEVPSEIDGFLSYAVPTNNQGNITIVQDSLRIETLPSSQPIAIVNALTNDFDWNFSAIAIEANGTSHPIAVSVDWKYGEFLAWSQPSAGWFYNYRSNETTWASTGIFIGNFTINEQYNFSIQWRKVSDYVNLNFSISGSGINKSQPISISTSIPPNTNIEYSRISLESWAADSSHGITRFYNNKVLCFNSLKFAEQNQLTNSAFLLGTLIIWVLTIWVVIWKRATLFSSVTLSKRVFYKINLLSPNKVIGLFKKLKLSLRHYWFVILIFIFFAALRLALAEFTLGHVFDEYASKAWLNIIQTKGVFSLYSYSDMLAPFLGLRPVFPYPPIIGYLLALFSNIPDKSNLIPIVIKLPGIVADLLLGAVVFVALKNRGLVSIAVPALVLSLLNFVDSAVWGQYDSIVALFIVLAIWLVATKRIELGWVFMALAICTKQTSLIILPALIVLTIKQKSWSRMFYGFLAFFAVSFFIWLPFIINSISMNFALGTSGLRLWAPGGGLDPLAPEGGGGTSIWAFNIWPIITTAMGHPPVLSIIGGVKDTFQNQFFVFSYFQLGLILFGSAYVYLTLKIWKSSNIKDVMLLFGLLMMAFYFLPTRIHERYLFFGLSFIPFVYDKSRKIVVSYLVLLATFSLTLVYPLTGGPFRTYTGFFSSFFNIVFSDYGLLTLCALNVLLFFSLLFSESNILVHLRKFIANRKVRIQQ